MPEQRWYEPYRWHFAAWELACLVPVALMIAAFESLKNIKGIYGYTYTAGNVRSIR